MMQQNPNDLLPIDESSLIPMHVLGHGSYGFVTLMRDSNYRCYAKKTSPMYHRNNLQKELNIMLRFQNYPCFVQAKSPILHYDNNKGVSIYMEYANKETLKHLISNVRAKSSLPFPDFTIQRAARMILQGLEVLHFNGYVHRDIKPSNLLLFPSTIWEEPWDLKLADFGLAKEPNSDSEQPYTLVGTHEYMPPESFEGAVIDGAFDIWSFGCIVYEMFGGKPQQEMLELYYDWILTKEISPVAKDFLKKCHAPYSLRPTATELLNHPFITQKLDRPSPKSTLEQDPSWLPRLPDSIW